MDHELATAVFQRWGQGLPVAETMLYKAAQVVGLDPGDALLEARWYTMLDHDLKKMASGEMPDPFDLRVYTAAAGLRTDDYSTEEFCKTAAAYALSPLELVLEKLARDNWVPDLQMLKLGMMQPPEAGIGGQEGAATMMQPGADMGGAAAPEAAMMPQPGAEVQQAPQERFKPGPMAPMQSPPSAEGNLQELVDASRHPDAGMAQAGGGMPTEDQAAMAPEEAQQPSPEEKIQQVAPDVPQERLPEYAAKLQELEQNVGMPVQDPAQITKFVAQMKKEDGKKIDEAIKQMAAPAPLTAGGGQQQQAGQAPAEGGGGAPQAPSPGVEKVAAAAALLAQIDIVKEAGPFGRLTELLKGGRTLGESSARYGVNITGKSAKHIERASKSRAGNHPFRTADLAYDTSKLKKQSPYGGIVDDLRNASKDQSSEALKSNALRLGIPAAGVGIYAGSKAKKKRDEKISKMPLKVKQAAISRALASGLAGGALGGAAGGAAGALSAPKGKKGKRALIMGAGGALAGGGAGTVLGRRMATKTPKSVPKQLATHPDLADIERTRQKVHAQGRAGGLSSEEVKKVDDFMDAMTEKTRKGLKKTAGMRRAARIKKVLMNRATGKSRKPFIGPGPSGAMTESTGNLTSALNRAKDKVTRSNSVGRGKRYSRQRRADLSM